MLEDFGVANEKTESAEEDEIIHEPEAHRGRQSSKSEDELGKLKQTQWAVIGNKKYVACSSTAYSLPPGVYSISWTNQHGITYCGQTFNTDDLIDFPDSVFYRVEKEIEAFWKLGEEFKSYGFLHKRGFLLYGPAGGGKSCLVSRICRNAIKQGGIVFIFERHVQDFLAGIALFREVEPGRQIVCVFEDLDAKIKECGESPILSLLDGENQVSGVINLATTNYPECLDRRIIARPRRFDGVIKVGMPNEAVRKIFFEEKFKLGSEDINKWVKASEGFSFAALSELVIGVKCLKNDFDEVVARLKEMHSKKISSEDFDNSAIGFVTPTTVPGN